MKKKQNKRGFLLHAFGNKDLDYGKLAVCCALSIKTNLKNNFVTVVMDKGTQNWLNDSVPKDILETAFDKIITPKERFRKAKRKHHDSPWYNFRAEFDNQNRVLSYNYSPYDETILMDSDYIVMSDTLDQVWGTNEDILINRRSIDLQCKEFSDITDLRLSNYGIPLYWATLVYFKKTPFAKTFFELVDYIRTEYNFFQFLYGFKEGFYRNDFTFAIAVHIMNGYYKKGINSFPIDYILASPQKDEIAEILDSKEIIFMSNNTDEPWRSTLVNMKDVDVHVMNKREFLRVSEKFIASCMEKI